jgi:hypothetical protein
MKQQTIGISEHVRAPILQICLAESGACAKPTCNSPKHPKPVPLTLVPPKEVKIDLNDFDLKLGENSSCTAF